VAAFVPDYRLAPWSNKVSRDWQDEVLLDESFRFVERAIAAAVDAKLDIWEGMAHGFRSGVGRLTAATEALNLIGDFLIERLTTQNHWD
jgi:acetyl esterase/lipase